MKRKSQTIKLSGKRSRLFLSDKAPSDEKIDLIEKDKIIKTDYKDSECFEYFLFYHHY